MLKWHTFAIDDTDALMYALKPLKYLEDPMAFKTMVLKNIAFSNSKNYFIYFNTSLYNIPKISDSIFYITTKNYYVFLFISLSFSFFVTLFLCLK